MYRTDDGFSRFVSLERFCQMLIVSLDKLTDSRLQVGDVGEGARYSARLSSCANQPSTAFSQDELDGVKCNLKRGCFPESESVL
jgi:hypothetical protein